MRPRNDEPRHAESTPVAPHSEYSPQPHGTSNPTRAAEGLRVEAGSLKHLGFLWVLRDTTGAVWEVHLPELAGKSTTCSHTPLPLSNDIKQALEEFEEGSDTGLRELKLGPAPTRFTKQVREVMLGIPRGQVLTYGQVARLVGNPNAARAVGRACGTNPLPVLVPCHRVVAARGVGGFALGLHAKQSLLALEGIDVALFAGFR